MLNELQSNVLLKIQRQDVAPCLKRIAQNHCLNPTKFERDMQNRMVRLDTSQEDSLLMATNMLCNSTKMYGEAISYLYGQNKKLKEQIDVNKK